MQKSENFYNNVMSKTAGNFDPLTLGLAAIGFH